MNATSQSYVDVVGHVERVWPAAYDSCISHDCPRCGAPAYEVCKNPLHGRRAKMPCVARLGAN